MNRDIFHEQACDNNNTIIKEPSDATKRFFSSEAVDRGQSCCEKMKLEFSQNEQAQSSLSNQKSYITFTDNYVISSKENQMDANLENNLSENRDSCSSPALTGLKNTALLAVDAIREKLSSFRRSLHSNSSQTSSVGECDKRSSNRSSTSSNTLCVTNGVNSSSTFEDAQNSDECNRGIDDDTLPTPFCELNENELGTEYKFNLSIYATDQSPSKSSTQLNNDHDHNTLVSKLSNQMLQIDSDRRNFIESEELCHSFPYGEITPNVQMTMPEHSTLNCNAVSLESLSKLDEQQEVGVSIDHSQKQSITTTNESTYDDAIKNSKKTISSPIDWSEITSANQGLTSDDALSLDNVTKKLESDELNDAAEETSSDDHAYRCSFCQESFEKNLPSNNDAEQELKISNNVGLEHMQCGIKLWQVQNASEETTIEIRCHVAQHEGHRNGQCDKHPLSITTDGMTEASPLSSPSSSRDISIEKSMSDSDFDNDFESKF